MPYALLSSHTGKTICDELTWVFSLKFHNLLCVVYIKFVFFFFQAEDGIRDYKVTGVQTCALPIFTSHLVGNFSTGLPGKFPTRWLVTTVFPSFSSHAIGSHVYSYFAEASVFHSLIAGRPL